MSNVLRKLRISFSVACGIFCLLLIVLWVRSYWSVDVFKGRLSNTIALQCASTDGRLLLVLYRSPVPLEWSWNTLTDTALEKQTALGQLRREYQMLLVSLERQASALKRRASAARNTQQDINALAAKLTRLNVEMTQLSVEFEVGRARIKEVAVSQMWNSPNQSEPLLSLGNVTRDFRSVSNDWGFGTARLATGRVVASPHWCLVLISGAIAVALDIRRSWRFSLRTLLVAVVAWLPYRFSLRTLLLTLTIAAVLLGAIVYAIR